jgi:hypothetical protein
VLLDLQELEFQYYHRVPEEIVRVALLIPHQRNIWFFQPHQREFVVIGLLRVVFHLPIKL